MRVILTEKQLKYIIEQSTLNEAARIRPWTDDDYRKVNPYQVKDVDFAAIKKYDDEYSDKMGLKKGKRINTGKEKYSKSDPIPQKRINDLQKDITKKIQKRYKDITDRNNAHIPMSELGTIGGKTNGALKRELAEKGLLLQVSGKAFAYGNQKLPEDTLIINITSAWNCPAAAKGECKIPNNCYDRQVEYKPNVQKRNLRMQQAYKYMTAREILELVEAYIESAPVRIKRIRISEGGDFPDQETVDFCDKLAGHLKAKYDIVTTAYTERNLDFSKVKNMIINGSSYLVKNPTRYFRCIPEDKWEKVPDGLNLAPYNIGFPKGLLDTQNGTFKCHCDCRQCNFCYQTKEENGEPQDKILSVAEIYRP